MEEGGHTPPHRRLTSRQIVRNRWLTVAVAVVALLNVSIITAVVAGEARSLIPVLLVIAPLMAASFLAWLRNRSVRLAAGGEELDESTRVAAGAVERVAEEFGIAAPRVVVSDEGMCNAYTMGSGDRAFIVFTEGLVALLNRQELEAVAAHEMAHIVNRDTDVGAFSYAVLCWA
ncbi:M48 family metalloprotease, partial [Streptomyces sp. CA-249302]|uniref:M48 family metalloprotease n=1 Tax=Streptomyces sp. CA-249302 TaxID=3240058 RepID=UPI003D8CADB9